MASSDRRPAPPGALPAPDRTRLARLSGADVVGALLAATGPRAPSAVRKAVDAFAEIADDALRQMAADGRVVESNGRWALSPDGHRSSVTSAVARGGYDWAQTRATILPTAALGLPLSRSSILHLSRGENLRTAAIVVLYDLPLDPGRVGWNEVRESLLVRALSTRFPEFRQPAVSGTAKLDPFSLSILRGIVGLGFADPSKLLTAFAERAADAAGPSIEELRDALIKGAIRYGRSGPADDPARAPVPTAARAAPPLAPGGTAPPSAGDLDEFVDRVRALTAAESTPPFADRLAIAALHDIYQRVYPDADALPAFKVRLLAAFRARRVSLRRLDYIDAIDQDLRRRSELEVDGRHFHFVARDP